MLRIDGISKRFGETDVLSGISADIEQGEFFTIIGPSGAGKSTLLRLINLLDTPTGGSISLDGISIHSDRSLEVRRRMGMVFQKPAVFKSTVYENIALGLRFRHEPESRIKEKVSESLDLVQLGGFEGRKAVTLSGGEMQRVAIARVMVTDPDLLLLDEPTANLDPVSVGVIEDLIIRINREFGTTIIMSTHDMFQGQRLAHRMGVMVDGTFAQIGTSREIFTTPHDRYVARFVGIENLIDGIISSTDGGIATIDAGGVKVQVVTPLSAGNRVTVCLRPEDIAVGLHPDHAESVRNVLQGTVVSITAMGPLTRLTLDCGIRLVAVVTWKAAEELGIEDGSTISASFKATAAHVLPLSR
ncbi:tungstate transport system ATP-binding protein [Methanocalculus alkaliphilus]|nr:tungstate transport system ATP-binding protein [Methanocalculus alkaliphilus]